MYATDANYLAVSERRLTLFVPFNLPCFALLSSSAWVLQDQAVGLAYTGFRVLPCVVLVEIGSGVDSQATLLII